MVIGYATWYAETVAGPGTTYSAPSIAETSTGFNITVEGPDGSLMFYWAEGTLTWDAETVAGPGTGYDPSIAETSNSANITAGG